VDPLRPISQILATLARQRSTDTPGATPLGNRGAKHDPNTLELAPSTPAPSLDARLRERLGAMGKKTTRQLAEAFVETVLVSEFGDAMSSDPGLASLTARVTSDLLANEEIASELSQLLVTYAESGHSPGI